MLEFHILIGNSLYFISKNLSKMWWITFWNVIFLKYIKIFNSYCFYSDSFYFNSPKHFLEYFRHQSGCQMPTEKSRYSPEVAVPRSRRILKFSRNSTGSDCKNVALSLFGLFHYFLLFRAQWTLISILQVHSKKIRKWCSQCLRYFDIDKFSF